MLRWLIAIPATLLREAQYLHVFEDGATEWAADPQRALRFSSKSGAEQFGTNHCVQNFRVEAWPAADLVVHAGDEVEPEDDGEDLDEAA